MAQITELVGVALGSGLTVKALDILYQELKSKRERGLTTQRTLEASLDPFLKSLDEVVGKFRSLAGEDFASLRPRRPPAGDVGDGDLLRLASAMYLITAFWARIELLRRDILFADFAANGRGQQLHEFVKCLESRRVRLVDRGTQRACAELTLQGGGSGAKIVPYIEYCNLLSSDARTQNWMRPLANLLAGSTDKSKRQRLLVYATLMHAMMDTLDPDRHVTSARPPFPNKLSKAARRDLKHRLFAQYLPFVPAPQRYFGQVAQNGGPQS